MEQPDPSQGETQLGRGRQVEGRSDDEGLEVEVGLVEAVEADDAVGSGLGELRDEVGERREVRRDLHRERHRDLLTYRPHQAEDLDLRRCRRVPGVRPDAVHVELEGIGTRVHERGRVAGPAASVVPFRLAITGTSSADLGVGDELEVAVELVGSHSGSGR